MTQIRQNEVTGRWVAVAPRRGHRPQDYGKGPAGARPEPFVASCPFCPGQEHELPAILAETAPAADGAPWGSRAVPNLYPAFSLEAPGSGGGEVGPTCPSRGLQEVVIESPFHDRDPSRLSEDELVGLLRVFQDRLEAARGQVPRGWPFLFKNHGRDAGASLEHPHSQLVVVDAPPSVMGDRADRLSRYHGETGRSLIHDSMTAWGESDGSVLDLESVRAVVPHAAEAPFETWIGLRDRGIPFEALGAGELTQLATAIGSVLTAYRDNCGDPPYNMMFHLPQFGSPADPVGGWCVAIRPRVGRLAGFELSSGVYINPSSPEADAEYLRSVLRVPVQIGE